MRDRGGRQVAGVQEVVSVCPRRGVRWNVHEGPFLFLFVRDPCSSAHATRRLCLGKPRSLGVLLWSATSTEAGAAQSRKARLRAQKIGAGQVTTSPSRIRTHHGRFLVVFVACRWTWRRLERRWRSLRFSVVAKETLLLTRTVVRWLF